MSHRDQTNLTLIARRVSHRRRRGAAYLLVLSAGIVLTVIGFGIMSASRSASRNASQTADIDEASVLAESAVECALALINNVTTWRTSFTSGVESVSVAVGRGTISVKLVDETDGNLSNNTADAVRLYGIGRVGSATRIFSVQLVNNGPPLDVLSSAAHSAGNFTVNDNLTVIGGPVSTNGTLSVLSGKTVTGDAKAAVFGGTITGTKTTLTTDMTMPATTAFDTYKALATTMAFTSITGGLVNKKVLGSGANTWYGGAPTAANGVYYIKVPSTGTLTIMNSRTLATLVVELDPGGKLLMSGAFAWDPPRTDYPTLIVKGSGTGSTVTLGGSVSALNEATNLTNFNPSGLPDSGGATDSDTLDTYASEFHGLLHVIGSTVPTTLQGNFVMKGTVITEGTLTTGTGVKLTLDPALASNPPQGYSGSTTMQPVAGSWRWEKTP
jgi:hypothetical protein